MNKSKNIILLSGIVFNSTLILGMAFKAVDNIPNVAADYNYKYFFFSYVLPLIIMLLLMVMPTLVFALNLKGKEGKVLPVISVIINSLLIFFLLFHSLTPTIPQYLIYSEIGLIDTYFPYVVYSLGNGGLSAIGYLCLLIGSALSVSKENKTNY